MTDLINLACTQYLVGADIKGILYSVIDKIGKEKIRIEVNSEIEMSQKRCDEILERLTQIKLLAVIPFSKGANYASIGKMIEDNLDVEMLLSM